MTMTIEETAALASDTADQYDKTIRLLQDGYHLAGACIGRDGFRVGPMVTRGQERIVVRRSGLLIRWWHPQGYRHARKTMYANPA